MYLHLSFIPILLFHHPLKFKITKLTCQKQITCHGGNGIAIGSLGQYLEDASVINVTVKDVNILTYNLDMHNSAYIKTWIGALVPQSGYESGGLPRGDGWYITLSFLFFPKPTLTPPGAT